MTFPSRPAGRIAEPRVRPASALRTSEFALVGTSGRPTGEADGPVRPKRSAVLK